MTTISREDKWIRTARLFGDSESVVRKAKFPFMLKSTDVIMLLSGIRPSA